jgi:hypothetical protein
VAAWALRGRAKSGPSMIEQQAAVVVHLALTVTHSLTFGELIVGVGTGLLALFTGYLGLETRKSARAAQTAVESSEEPFVIATPTDSLEDMALRGHEHPQSGQRPPFVIHRAYDNDGHFVRLRLWNIGLGPGIVERVQLRLRDSTELLDSLERFYPLAVGHVADIEVRSLAWPDWSPVAAAATLVVTYTHASGRLYATRSVATIEDQFVFCISYKRERVYEEPDSALRAAQLRRGHYSPTRDPTANSSRSESLRSPFLVGKPRDHVRSHGAAFVYGIPSGTMRTTCLHPAWSGTV